jgi:hypothetical protein
MSKRCRDCLLKRSRNITLTSAEPILQTRQRHFPDDADTEFVIVITQVQA